MRIQWLRNLSIARKIMVAFGIVCVLCSLLGCYTCLTFHSIVESNQEVSDHAFPSVVLLSDARGAMNVVRRRDLVLSMCQSPLCVSENSAKRQKALEDYQSDMEKYEPLIARPGEQELFRKAEVAFAQYRELSDRGVGLAASGKAGDALDVLEAQGVQFVQRLGRPGRIPPALGEGCEFGEFRGIDVLGRGVHKYLQCRRRHISNSRGR